MALTNHHQISLYEEAKAGLDSLIKQIAQVGVCFLVMLLFTGGNPPVLAVALSSIGGIGFVAWNEQKRLTKQRVRAEKLIIPSKLERHNFAELIKNYALNPFEDFAGANLVGIQGVDCDLKGFNLSGADLSQADLSRADLTNANLSGANLTNANLTSANLNGANLSHTNLDNIMLFLANLSNANLSNANLNNANLILANLTDANLNSAKLSSVNLTSSKILQTDLSEVDMNTAEVKNAQFASNSGLSESTKSDLQRRGAIFPQDELAALEI